MNKIKLFIFDLDGVITNTANLHYLAWKKTFIENFNIDLELEYLDKLRGVSRTNAAQLVLKNYNLSDEVSDEQITRLCEEKNAYYIELLSEINKSFMFDGILETLEYLKSNNYYIALGSVSENAKFIVKQLEIMPYFDYIVDPTTLTKPKPDPEIFNNAKNYFNLSAEECIVIEDSQAGIKSAKKANIKTIGIKVDADYMIDNTKELLELIINITNDNRGDI